MQVLDYINITKQPFDPDKIPIPLRLAWQGDVYGIRLLHAGIVTYAAGEIIPLEIHQHPVYHIVLYTENSDFFAMNDTMHLAVPGTLIVTSPTDRHCFAPFRRNAFTYTEIAFTVENHHTRLSLSMCELLKFLFKVAPTERKIPIQLGKHAARLLKNNIAMLVGQYADTDPIRRAAGAITLLNILFYLVDNYFNPELGNHELPPILSSLEVVKKEIELKLTHPLEIKKLAVLAGLSPNYFNTAFRREYGMPPIRYQLFLRIEEAKRLLTTTALRVQEISEQLGFRDLFYFSRQFKRFTGMSPLHFRQRK